MDVFTSTSVISTDEIKVPARVDIKPSRAILRGCAVSAPWMGDIFETVGPEHKLHACAWGAIYLGVGLTWEAIRAESDRLDISNSDVIEQFSSLNRDWETRVSTAYREAYGASIADDNDNGMSREQIALRLARIGL